MGLPHRSRGPYQRSAFVWTIVTRFHRDSGVTGRRSRIPRSAPSRCREVEQTWVPRRKPAAARRSARCAMPDDAVHDEARRRRLEPNATREEHPRASEQEVHTMCYERRSRWMREREEGRQIWDLFARETQDEPPQPVAETTPREDPEPAELSHEPVVPAR